MAFIKIIVTECTCSSVYILNFSAAFIADVVAQIMAVAGHISNIIFQAIEHIKVGAISVSSIIEPVASADVMVAVKSICLVSNSKAKTNGMSWNRIRKFIYISFSITSAFKPI